MISHNKKIQNQNPILPNLKKKNKTKNSKKEVVTPKSNKRRSSSK